MSDASIADAPPSVARTSGALLAARILGAAGFFVAAVILARSLGPAGRGTLAFVIVVALLVARLASFGIGGATVYFAARRPAERARILGTNAGFVAVSGGAVITVIAAFLLLVPGARPDSLTSELIWLMIPGTILVCVVEWGLSFLLGARVLRAQSIAMGLGPWLYAVALGVTALGGDLDVERAATAWVASGAAWVTLIAVLAITATGIARPSLALLVESIRFGVRAWAGGLARSVNTRIDQLLMAYLTTQAALGVYAVAVNVSEALQYIPGAIAMAFAPAVAATAAGDRRDRTLRTFRGALLVTLVTIPPAMVVGAVLLPVVFGEAFRASIVPFLVLAPGAIGFLVMRVFSSALMGAALPGRSSVPAIAALATGVALDLLLVPPYEATGAAVASTAAFAVGGLVAVVLYRRADSFAPRELVPDRADARQIADRASRAFGRVQRRRRETTGSTTE
jgi:O-antigen/teichoic acid export membrane protein